jgi:hypothetical protein
MGRPRPSLVLKPIQHMLVSRFQAAFAESSPAEQGVQLRPLLKTVITR